MLAYDIDGTLAGVDFTDIFSTKGLLTKYAEAKVLYQPKNKFIAVTARGTDPEVKDVTRKWLAKNQPNCEGVFFVGGSEKDKIVGKANIVKRENADGYVDTNIKTLSKFKEYGVTGIKLYHLILSTGEIKLYTEL